MKTCRLRGHRGSSWRGIGSPPVLSLVLVLFFGLPLAGDVHAQGAGEELRAYLDRTDELLDWAGDLVSQSGSDQARRVLDGARQLQQRGRDLMSRQRPLDAFAVGRRARDAMWHSVRLARDAAGLEERLRLRRERFDDQYGQLAERAREGAPGRASDLLEQAQEQARRAGERTTQGDLQLALKLLEQADDLLRKAARLLAEGAGPERLRQDLERTRQLVDDAESRLSGADAGVLATVAEARTALERAEEAASAGEPGLVLQHAALARRLAQRALAEAGERPDAEAVSRLLARFDERAGELAGPVREAGDGPGLRAFERAQEQREAAARALKEGRPGVALRHLRSAHELLEQAGRGLR